MLGCHHQHSVTLSLPWSCQGTEWNLAELLCHVRVSDALYNQGASDPFCFPGAVHLENDELGVFLSFPNSSAKREEHAATELH